MRKVIGWAMLGSVVAAPLVGLGIQSGFAETMRAIAFIAGLFTWVWAGVWLVSARR